MLHRVLGRTGITVSELGLGTWGLSGDGYSPMPEAEQDALIDRALALGVTLFDTADSYGKGAMETRLGARLAGHPEAVIVTKLGTDREASPARKSFDPLFIREGFERSRERLKREVIDVVLLHNPSESTLARGEATAVLQELQYAGRIRTWGVSVEGVDAARIAIHQGVKVLEVAYNAFHSRTLQQLEGEIRNHGIAILARSVLAHGLLCGQWPFDKQFARDDHRSERWTSDDLKRRISQLNAIRPCVNGSTVQSLRAAALRYVLANNLVSCAVLGPRNGLQLDQLLREAGGHPYLSPEALDALQIRLDNVKASRLMSVTGAGGGVGIGGSAGLLGTLDAIAREAAVLIREVYATKFNVDFKAPRDPVTEADRRANELICDRLSKLFPNVPIVAEESEPETFAGYRKADRIFFVDPLDGTREFVAKNGEFVVMIGYVEGERATASVIHAPVSGVSWLGELGTGAYQIEADGSQKPISVSALSTLAEARIVGSRSHRNPALEQALATLGARELVALGSAGLKASVVAHGEADAHVAPHYAGKRWDACAADALIHAAGGKLTDSRGDLFDYRSERLDNDRGVVASNGLLHDAIIEKLALARG